MRHSSDGGFTFSRAAHLLRKKKKWQTVEHSDEKTLENHTKLYSVY